MSGKDSWDRLHALLFPDGPPEPATVEEMDEAIHRAMVERWIIKRVRESDDWERVDEDAVVREFSLEGSPPELQQIDAVVARLAREGGQSK